jgi:hypothetical protein
MECCLVGDKTMNDGGAVALLGKAHSGKPGGPSGSQVSLEADFVLSGVVVAGLTALAFLALCLDGPQPALRTFIALIES